MLVVWSQAPEVGTSERIAVDAIAGGWATTDHYNVLADCRDLLAIAVSIKPDASAAAVAELNLIALLNIKDRFEETGKIGASGDELQALRLLADTSEDFWQRQSGELFRGANGVLDQERKGQQPTPQNVALSNADVPSFVANAVRCGVCGSPADRHGQMFQCQQTPGHIADTMTGLFADHTAPVSIRRGAR